MFLQKGMMGNRMEGSGRPLTNNLQSINQYSIIINNKIPEVQQEEEEYTTMLLLHLERESERERDDGGGCCCHGN